MSVEHQRNGFLISTDKSKLDIAAIHDYLSRESYWAQNIPLNVVQKSIHNSLCFGVYNREKQVGFARVVSDLATFAWIGDVFIIETHRGKGLSKWLMECIMSHPDLASLRRWMLATRDAQELYRKFGFQTVTNPENYMVIRNPDIYNKLDQSR